MIVVRTIVQVAPDFEVFSPEKRLAEINSDMELLLFTADDVRAKYSAIVFLDYS